MLTLLEWTYEDTRATATEVLDGNNDWDEVAELVTDSYRFCAPRS